MIQKLDLAFNISELNKDLDWVQKRYEFHPTSQQIGLTHRPWAEPKNKIYDCIGSLWDEQKQVFIAEEADFSEFFSELKGTYFFEVYKEVCRWSRLGVGRVRLMRRRPFSCYSMHIDVDFRYHIALTSNEHSYVFFADGDSYKIPTDGHLYEFRAQRPHTAFNAGDTDRIHLVFGTFEKELNVFGSATL